ncbi:hypothetical protein GZ998_05500 [Actinomyces sp. 594]|uniref:hypothetical protein n=1 Tax=Actinomyces sp. 594 TaxID=2057793 RepID=UPI001C57FD8C|nr:hypothetical protein [Actinomyces sp. 594]MBW3068968.1 hypothetical protein [Actinomyces sp. 594]
MMTLRATAGAAVVALVAAGLGGCAGDAEPAPTPTATSGVRVTVPQEQAPQPAASGSEASATPTPADTAAVEAAGQVVLALACGDNSTDLTDDLDGQAAVSVPTELEARAATNEQLMARMGTTMHAQLVDGDWLTVHNDSRGIVLMVYTVSWEAQPDQKAVPDALRQARPGDPGVTAWAVTLTADGDGAWRVIDVATGSQADPD